MAKLTFVGQGNVDALADELKKRFPKTGVSCELVDEARNATNETIMLVFEKYFMRVKNRVSVSILIYPVTDGIGVAVIGSGGGQGALLSFDWGSEDSIAQSAGNILLELGFREID